MTSSDFGIAVGAGVRGKLGPLTGIMAMPMYHVIFTEEENTTYLYSRCGACILTTGDIFLTSQPFWLTIQMYAGTGKTIS